MEQPKSIFRAQDGCVYEDYSEAHHYSISLAAEELRRSMCLSQASVCDSGDTLLVNIHGINGAIKELQAAFKGKYVTEYVIKKVNS